MVEKKTAAGAFHIPYVGDEGKGKRREHFPRANWEFRRRIITVKRAIAVTYGAFKYLDDGSSARPCAPVVFPKSVTSNKKERPPLTFYTNRKWLELLSFRAYSIRKILDRIFRFPIPAHISVRLALKLSNPRPHRYIVVRSRNSNCPGRRNFFPFVIQ